MTEPDDIPQMCRFAEALVIPRLQRIEEDLTKTERDIDSAHAAIRQVCADMKAVTLEHSEHRRRIGVLETSVTDHTRLHALLRGDVAELKVRVDAIFERLHEISVGIAGLRTDNETQEKTLLQREKAESSRHKSRMRVLILIATLLGGLFGFATLAHETISGKPISESVKALLGIVK